MNLSDFELLRTLPPWEYPPDAGLVICKVMTDKSSPLPDRVEAAQMAGEFTVINDDVAENLLQIVGDRTEDADLRSAAAIAFGPALEEASTNDPDEDEDMFGDPQAVTWPFIHKILAKLKELHHDPAEPELVRRRALEAAVRFPEDWHVLAIAAAAEQPGNQWRQTAAFCMRYCRGFEKEILDYMKDSDAMVRMHAVQASGEWNIKEAWPEIEKILRREGPQTGDEKSILLAAIEASASVNPEEAGEVLDDWLHCEDEQIADAASEALEAAESGIWVDSDDDDDDDDDGDDDDEDEDGDKDDKSKRK